MKIRINEAIDLPEIRLIESDGSMRVLATASALALARERGLDLVEVNPKAQPPVCRIMDMSKYR